MNGVPALLNKYPQNVALTVVGVVAAAVWNFLTAKTSWGIFEEGSSFPAIAVDSVVEMTNTMTSQVSKYRIEDGSFASFNKVQEPRAVHIRVSRGGSAASRDALIAWAEENVADTTVFDVVTPERALTSMTLVSYSNRRESKAGVTVVYLDCVFQEIREVEPEYSTSEKEPAADTTAAASPADKPATPVSAAQPETPSGPVTTPDTGTSNWNYSDSVNATEGGESQGIAWGNDRIDYNYQQSLHDAHTTGGM